MPYEKRELCFLQVLSFSRVNFLYLIFVEIKNKIYLWRKLCTWKYSSLVVLREIYWDIILIIDSVIYMRESLIYDSEIVIYFNPCIYLLVHAASYSFDNKCLLRLFSATNCLSKDNNSTGNFNTFSILKMVLA